MGVLRHVFESEATFGKVSLMVAQLTFVKVKTRLVGRKWVGRKNRVMVLIKGWTTLDNRVFRIIRRWSMLVVGWFEDRGRANKCLRKVILFEMCFMVEELLM